MKTLIYNEIRIFFSKRNIGIFIIGCLSMIVIFCFYFVPKHNNFIYAFGFSQFERGIRAKTTKPPAMRVVSKNVIQNNHHSFYNEGVQAIKIRKNGDYNG